MIKICIINFCFCYTKFTSRNNLTYHKMQHFSHKFHPVSHVFNILTFGIFYKLQEDNNILLNHTLPYQHNEVRNFNMKVHCYFIFGILFSDAFSITGLYSVNALLLAELPTICIFDCRFIY